MLVRNSVRNQIDQLAVRDLRAKLIFYTETEKFQNVCGPIYHWRKKRPDSYEIKTKSKDESQITLLRE